MPQVRLIDEKGNQVGVVDTREALQMARDRGLDLMEVSAASSPPVCKICDYGKFKYEKKKKEHDARKKQTVIKVKVPAAASGILAGYFASFLSGHEQAGVLFTACGHEFNRYNMLFAAGIVVKCVADFGLLPRVSDTQAKPTRFAIQYILDTMYDNMHTRILAPVRSLSLLPAESFRPWRWFK